MSDQGAVPLLAEMAARYAANERVTFGKTFASNGLKVDGRIFAMAVKGRLVVKLPRARVDELVERGAGERFDAGKGKPMREWIALSGGAESWPGLVEEAFAFVASA
jgi:TfoX/Sxy family transcriptional regulator of competence genes